MDDQQDNGEMRASEKYNQDDQLFSREGTPYGSPGGVIKRWIRRYRHDESEDTRSTGSRFDTERGSRSRDDYEFSGETTGATWGSPARGFKQAVRWLKALFRDNSREK